MYWTGSPLPIYGFNHDKLSEVETQSLQVLDSFRLFKVKDLLPLPDKKVLTFLGKAHFNSPPPKGFLHTLFFMFFADKMIDLSVKEQKKLMVAARAAQRGARGPSKSKFDLTGLEL